MTKKEVLIDRLLENNDINADEAMELRREEIQFIPIPHIIPQEPYNPYPQPLYPLPQISPQQRWMNEELDRRAKIVERCGCNPANGGSGMCGCTMGGMVIIC